MSIERKEINYTTRSLIKRREHVLRSSLRARFHRIKGGKKETFANGMMRGARKRKVHIEYSIYNIQYIQYIVNTFYLQYSVHSTCESGES